MLACFEKWNTDSTEVLTGKARLFENDDIDTEDEIFVKLVEPSEFWDGMTKQCLELIFESFLVKTNKMLSDHLKGGKYDKVSDDVREESKGVLKTNVVPERDFAMLDRVMAQKPNATTMVYEAIIMCTKNDTINWRNKLDPAKREQIMQLARKSKDQQRKQYKERRLELRRVQEQKMAENLEAKQRKEMKERVQKQQLVEKVEDFGGLWKTFVEVEEKLNSLNGKDKVAALHAQIQFRRKVLGAVHPDKKVFQMSTNGKQFTVQELKANLQKIIAQSELENQTCCNIVMERDGEVAKGPVLAEYRDIAKKHMEAQQNQGTGNQKKRKREGTVSKDKRPKRVSLNASDLPIIILPEELVGKKVSHHCVGDDGKTSWFRGTVLAMQTGKSQRNPDFVVRYDGYDEPYLFSFDDFKHGIVVLVSVSTVDFVGKKISQRFEDEHNHESWWETGHVLCVVQGSDERNPEFEYEDSEDADEVVEDDEVTVGPEICTFNLFEDYVKNDLVFL